MDFFGGSNFAVCFSHCFSGTLLLCEVLCDFPGDSDGKEFICNARDQVQSLGWEDPLEKEMATHSSILAWKIPWTEEGYSPWGRRESDTTDFYAKDVGSSS